MSDTALSDTPHLLADPSDAANDRIPRLRLAITRIFIRFDGNIPPSAEKDPMMTGRDAAPPDR
jgi:hypothetical protein